MSQQETLQKLKAAVENGEVLSKNAQKRLIKLQSKAERRERQKADRKARRQIRNARVDVAESAPGAASSAAVAPAVPVQPISRGAEHHAAAWDFWRRIGSPRMVLAPMVNQSELAFRLLARHYGATLTYTPMLHSTLFASSQEYRLDNFDAHAQDRPLVTQFCGDDPATLLAAAALAQGECDAVDLNCGCPQAIARRGHYGAFLLDEPDLVARIVETMAAPCAGARLEPPELADARLPVGPAHVRASCRDRGALRVPVLVKMRLLPSLEQTVALATRLQAAGASVLTLHGRTREQKCMVECDWAAIRAVKAALSIPVIANGGIERPEDLERCLAATGCDAVMVSEAALENPALFGGAPTSRATQLDVTRQYLRLARAHPPRASSVVKAHLFKLLYLALQLDALKPMRDKLGAALLLDDILAIGEEVCQAEEQQLQHDAAAMRQRCDEEGCARVSWYRRHRPYESATVPFGKKDAPAPEATVSLVDIYARSGDGCPGAAGCVGAAE
eukprot:Transcript_23802.p2 GENE.Transcript_23802~~Transcript_23802.p2  ORF type:complete len:578 (-),score=227.81 Transcript_23802:2292-3806(-)